MDTQSSDAIVEDVTPAAVAGDLPAIDDERNANDDMSELTLSDDARRARWQARRPDISHLAPGVADVGGQRVPLFDVGDRIVVDRRTSFLRGEPWLDTTVGTVRSIDDDTGLVTVYDEDGDDRNLPIKYFSFLEPLQEFRRAPARGNPFDAVKAPRAAIVRAQEAVDGTAPVKKGRGRPPGSKNRPKDVIKAEREAYKKIREEKRARRGR